MHTCLCNMYVQNKAKEQSKRTKAKTNLSRLSESGD